VRSVRDALGAALPRRDEVDVRTLAIYAGAAVAYVAAGVFETDFMLSVIVAIAYLLVVAWLLPALVARLR
jgi:hypothetical protein